MNSHEVEKERRRQKRIQRLGSDIPACVVCGQRDDCCLELHHLSGQKFGDDVVIICRNCHRILSDDQLDHPKSIASVPGDLESIGRWLLGLGDLNASLAEKLSENGRHLIAEAKARSKEDRDEE